MVMVTNVLPFTIASLSMFASSVHSLGCYHGGLPFNELHGTSADLHQEVVNDINTSCNIVAGTTFQAHNGEWNHCSEWAFERYNDCYETCVDGCNAMPSTWASQGCLLGCDPNCGGIETGTNHIDWTIRHDDNGDDDRTITWDVCNAAYNTELGGCSSGSEQNHDGFWFRIDPNDGPCPK